MIPRADSLLTPEERELVSNVASPGRTVLKIHFIRKEGGNLSGTLDPYNDPDCDCRVTTTFQGTFRDARTIEGTFSTDHLFQGGASPAGGGGSRESRNSDGTWNCNYNCSCLCTFRSRGLIGRLVVRRDLQVKGVQEPVQRRREQDTDHCDEGHTTEQRVETGEDVKAQ